MLLPSTLLVQTTVARVTQILLTIQALYGALLLLAFLTNSDSPVFFIVVLIAIVLRRLTCLVFDLVTLVAEVSVAVQTLAENPFVATIASKIHS